MNKCMPVFLPAVTGFAIFTFVARSLSVCENNIHLNQLLKFKWEQCTLGNKENTLDGSKQHDTQCSYELQHCEMRLQPLEQVNARFRKLFISGQMIKSISIAEENSLTRKLVPFYWTASGPWINWKGSAYVTCNICKLLLSER